MTRDQIWEEVKKVLIEEFRVEPEKVIRSATFAELDLDSLDLVQLALTCEDRFGIEIPEGDLEGILLLDQAVDLVERKVLSRAG